MLSHKEARCYQSLVSSPSKKQGFSWLRNIWRYWGRWGLSLETLLVSAHWRCHEKFKPATVYVFPKEQKESNKDRDLQRLYLSLTAPEQSKNMSSTTASYPANGVRTTTTLLECARLIQKISCTYFPVKPFDILCWRLFFWILFKEPMAFLNCFEFTHLSYDDNFYNF